MWANNSVFYQIYPLGFCGAPRENDGICESRIQKIGKWAPHIARLGANAVYMGPVFESDRHGYDTRDYRKVDCRLGTNDDLKEVCATLKENGLRVIFDGVFNHVGRGFWAFLDVLQNREASQYRDWFFVDFGGNSCYNDGLWYKGWEGHYELVELNLQNRAVRDYIFESVRMWIEEFGIDGLRLDVAYLIDTGFLQELVAFCKSIKSDFFVLGEIIHGDYNRLLRDAGLDSCTNYECYKGLHSSFNSMNMFEISYSLNRQFGSEDWCLYRGRNLLTFCDNHDVSRIASILSDKNHLKPLYAMMFGMPGIPCIYYGSEWGAEGDKAQGDEALRLSYDEPVWNELGEFISRLAKAKKESKALSYGSFRNIMINNKQLIFERVFEDERVLVAINADSEDFLAHFDAGAGRAIDLISGKEHDFGAGSLLEGYGAYFWKIF